VPDGRRLGHVDVVCVIIIACVDGKEEKKRGNGDWVRGLKVVQLARAEVFSYVQRATIPSESFIYTLNI
jgi:hypothetical protein